MQHIIKTDIRCKFVRRKAFFKIDRVIAFQTNSQKNMYTYKIHLHKETEVGYTVSVPALPGCITYGEHVDEAIEMAKEAIELYIEALQERGEAIPDDSNTLEYSLNLEAS